MKNNITYMNQKNKINKKKLIIFISLMVIILSILTIFIIYLNNEGFRRFWDIKVLRKNIEESNLTTIEIADTNGANIFALSNYIAVFRNNTLVEYNQYGKQTKEIKIEITTPVIANNDNYAVIAEKNGQKIYLIQKDNVLWQKELEGNISRINVNENGYVSVILSGTAYKSVIVLFDYKRRGSV